MGLHHLPTELLLCIADHLPRARDLNALLRTSWPLYHSLQTSLYHHNIQHDGSSALLWAAARGRADMVQTILPLPGANPNVRCPSTFETPLITAARHGHADIARLLLAAAAAAAAADVTVDVNAQDDNGETALAAAAQAGHPQIVRLLLRDARVNANLEDGDGRTPLAQAAISGSTAVVRLLLEAEEAIAPDAPDAELWTPLTFAAAAGHLEIVRCLLQQPGRVVDVNARDRNGATPLMWAARRGVAHVVEVLLRRDDIDVACVDEDGRTAVMWAEEHGHRDLVPLFHAFTRRPGNGE